MAGTLDRYVQLLDARDAAADALVYATDDAARRKARRAYNTAMRALTTWQYETEA